MQLSRQEAEVDVVVGTIRQFLGAPDFTVGESGLFVGARFLKGPSIFEMLGAVADPLSSTELKIKICDRRIVFFCVGIGV